MSATVRLAPMGRAEDGAWRSAAGWGDGVVSRTVGIEKGEGGGGRGGGGGRTFSDAEDPEILKFNDDGEGGEDALGEGGAAVEVGTDLGILDPALVCEIGLGCLWNLGQGMHRKREREKSVPRRSWERERP